MRMMLDVGLWMTDYGCCVMYVGQWVMAGG